MGGACYWRVNQGLCWQARTENAQAGNAAACPTDRSSANAFHRCGYCSFPKRCSAQATSSCGRKSITVAFRQRSADQIVRCASCTEWSDLFSASLTRSEARRYDRACAARSLPKTEPLTNPMEGLWAIFCQSTIDDGDRSPRRLFFGNKAQAASAKALSGDCETLIVGV